MHKVTFVLTVTIAFAACATTPPPRYVVTRTPFELLDPAHTGFCIAVDPNDPKGVWWWEPGRNGCASRSTGPAAFPGENGKVTALPSGGHDIHFQIQLMKGPPLEVDFRLDDTGMRWLAGGVTVPVERRVSLELPESPPQPRNTR